MNLFKLFKKKESQKVNKETQEKLDLILALTLSTAMMGLKKNEYVELAPLPGVCGPFKLSGNSLPVFEYIVFEKDLMEFIQIRVEVSKPDRIHFTASISCKGAAGEHEKSERHGTEVEMKEKYKEPFLKLASFLKAYFPFPMRPIDADPNRVDTQKEIPVDQHASH